MILIGQHKSCTNSRGNPIFFAGNRLTEKQRQMKNELHQQPKDKQTILTFCVRAWIWLSPTFTGISTGEKTTTTKHTHKRTLQQWRNNEGPFLKSNCLNGNIFVLAVVDSVAVARDCSCTRKSLLPSLAALESSLVAWESFKSGSSSFPNHRLLIVLITGI